MHLISRATSTPMAKGLPSVSACLLAALLGALMVLTTAPFSRGGQGPVANFSGSLDVRIHPREGDRKPPVALLLTDPKQRRVGWDPQKRERVQEIPGAFYEQESLEDAVTGDPGPVTLVLYVVNPVAGDYSLRVIGLEEGRYTLAVRALDRTRTPSRVEFSNVPITAGMVHRYRISHTNEPGSVVEVVPPDAVRKQAAPE